MNPENPDALNPDSAAAPASACSGVPPLASGAPDVPDLGEDEPLEDGDRLRARIAALEADRLTVAQEAVRIAAAQGTPVPASFSPLSDGSSEPSQRKGYLRLYDAIQKTFSRE